MRLSRRSSRPVVLAIALAAATTAATRGARAQGNDRSSPTGGRTALMGNAGVALARDGAAPFLNPATIVRIDDQSLAFSVNFYTVQITSYGSWHQPGAVDPRFGNVALQDTAVTSSGFAALPSTLCLFFTVAGIGEPSEDPDAPRWRRGRQKLAACLGSLEAEDVSLPALSFRGTVPGGTTAQVQSVARKWNRLHIGPTYSAQITDDFALGASLHGVYTSDSFVIDGSSVTSETGGAATASTLGAAGNGHSIDLAAILGATLRVERLTFGASVQLPPLHVAGAYDATLTSEATGATVLTSGSGSFVASPPVRVTVGVGSESKRLTWELDESYDFPRSDAIRADLHVDSTTATTGPATPTAFDATYAIRAQPVWNTSAGAEYFVSPSFSVVGGLSTNLSALPALAPTTTLGNVVQARTSRVALSFGVGSYGPAGNLLLGTQLGYAWGQAMAVNPYVIPNQWAVVDTQQASAMLILAGSTNWRAIETAVKQVEHVVTQGKPQDAPAPAPP